MNLAFIDWLIVVLFTSGVIFSVFATRHYLKNVADFLAAGRTAGRYLIGMSQGMAMLGAITIVGYFEMNYIAGFVMRWWEFAMSVVLVAITVSGWVVYRFRQTRALTMAQFFEIRYSRNFRIFAGLLAYFSGIINFGIFPAVGARFFIYFCGLPFTYLLFGIEISTYASVMFFLLGISLFFVYAGGQIAIIVADFLQGIFVNAVFVIIVIYFLFTFDWKIISETLTSGHKEASLINPFHTAQVKDFNFWYFLIGVAGVIYGKLSWQGTQGYNTSAKSAHEAKMGDVLSNWRNIPQYSLFLVFVPVIAYTVMHHPEYFVQAASVNNTLSGVNSEAIRSQLIVPLVLVKILPVGLMGAFAAVMLAAFIGNHDTYLHSWGSIFIQDVIMPFRKKPFSPKQHLRLLRFSILGVAIFIFIFSLIFQQSEYIFLFFAITGAIFAGGSGAVIIGGLYWKRGTTAAAWSAMITGSTIAVGGIIIHQIAPGFFINGQQFWGIAMAAAALVYVLVSITGKKTEFDMNKMLNRGNYNADAAVANSLAQKGWKILGMGKEFTRGDRVIYILTYSWTLLWVCVFVVGTVFNLTSEISDESWMLFWKIFILTNLALSIVVVIWFAIGGVKDLKIMFALLNSQVKDENDTGFVDKN